MVRFQRAQAMVREHVVGKLNGLLARLGIKCELQVTGLPSPEDIQQTEGELLEGRVTFSVASDRVRL
jgi:hypothetical protein